MENKPANFSPSNIETIDAALLDFVEGLNLFCTTINGWEKVPVIWASAERAYQIKNNRQLRDSNGTLIPPIISIERISTAKDPSKKGGFINSVSPKNDRYVYAQLLNQEATSKYASNLSQKTSNQINFITSKKNNKKVYKYYSLPIPVYITVEYKINILTSYQAQMNEIVQPFMARTGQNYFKIEKEHHSYEAFLDQNFAQDSISSLDEEERKFKATIDIKVLGYLLGEGANSEKSSYDIIENAVDVKLPKETLVLSQENFEQEKPTNILPNSGKILTSGVAVKKTFLIGDPAFFTYIINHNFNSRDLFITVRSDDPADDYEKVEVAISFINLNTIEIDIGDAPPPDKKYVVTILG